MNLSDLDLFLNNLDTETMNCTHLGDVNSSDFQIIGDNAWAQLIKPTPSENSCSQSPENPPANNNIGGFFLENSKVEESTNDSGRRWSSSLKNTPSILSFDVLSSSKALQERPSVQRMSKKLKTTHSRSESANHEHVIAERKRRERVTQYISALGRLVPGLKKKDKASVLTKTIEYMKKMQERVKTLEQVVKGHGEALPTTSNQSKLISVSSTEEPGPKIEIKAFGRTYLIMIHCFQARKGTLMKALNLIENLHLRVLTIHSVQISEQILDLTITSQVEDGFEMKMEVLLKWLKLEFQNLA